MDSFLNNSVLAGLAFVAVKFDRTLLLAQTDIEKFYQQREGNSEYK